MSDEEMSHDQLLRSIARNALAGYRAGKISLRRLIADLDAVLNHLEKSEWSDEFRSHCGTLELIYAVALYRGTLDSLSPDELADIDEAIAALEAHLESWPADGAPCSGCD